MRVLLKLKVWTTAGNALPTSEANELGVALQNAIQKAYANISVNVFAIFKHEDTSKLDHVYIATAKTIKNYDMKNSFRSLAQHLDGPPFLKGTQGKLKYSLELSNRVGVWLGRAPDANTKPYFEIRATDLMTQHELTRIYQNDEAVEEVWRSNFQELSPLLYCKLVQLREDEYKQRNGMVTLMAFNGSLEIRSTPNYFHVTTNEIRVCANEYIRPSNTSRAAMMMNFVHLITIQMYEICILLCIWALN